MTRPYWMNDVPEPLSLLRGPILVTIEDLDDEGVVAKFEGTGLFAVALGVDEALDSLKEEIFEFASDISAKIEDGVRVGGPLAAQWTTFLTWVGVPSGLRRLASAPSEARKPQGTKMSKAETMKMVKGRRVAICDAKSGAVIEGAKLEDLLFDAAQVASGMAPHACMFLGEARVVLRPAEPADRETGLYQKWDVRRLHDSKGKHSGCKTFVLDLDHDPFSKAALLAYADACQIEFPLLAKDIWKLLGMES